jgi:hypothetical protein
MTSYITRDGGQGRWLLGFLVGTLAAASAIRAPAQANVDPGPACNQGVLQKPEFADIATKLPLADIRKITFPMLADESTATDQERQAISDYFSAHEQCNERVDDWRRSHYAPEFYQALTEADGQLLSIGVDLYNRKISFGEANKQIKQLTADAVAKITAMAQARQAALQAQADADVERENLARAQEQDARRQRALLLLGMMRANQAAPIVPYRLPTPTDVHLHANCATTTIGSVASTNCN